jgi:hypothetical protein
MTVIDSTIYILHLVQQFNNTILPKIKQTNMKKPTKTPPQKTKKNTKTNKSFQCHAIFVIVWFFFALFFLTIFRVIEIACKIKSHYAYFCSRLVRQDMDVNQHETLHRK